MQDATNEVNQLRDTYKDRLAEHEVEGTKATEDATLTAGHEFMAAIRRNGAAIKSNPAAFRA